MSIALFISAVSVNVQKTLYSDSKLDQPQKSWNVVPMTVMDKIVLFCLHVIGIYFTVNIFSGLEIKK